MVKKLKIEPRFGVLNDLTESCTELSFKKPIIKSVHILQDVRDKELERLINIYLMQKTASAKDTESITKAMKRWVEWLEETGICWKTPSVIHSKSPTYGFKQELQCCVNDNSIKTSHNTAANYINCLKSFYEFLIRNNQVPSQGFFEYEIAHHDKGFTTTTDLRIRRTSSHDSNLRPLSAADCQNTVHTINKMDDRDRLLFSLMIDCGFRGAEARTMNRRLIKIDTLVNADSFLIRGVRISPKVGVQTKFGIEREMFITKPLYESLLDYTESPEYEARLKLYEKKYGTSEYYSPLFIAATGEHLSESTQRSMWEKFKKQYKRQHGKTLNHKPHDLRATFGTNLLALLTNEFKDVMAALRVVKDAMGHKHESTTLQYAEYLSHSDMLDKAAEIPEGSPRI